MTEWQGAGTAPRVAHGDECTEPVQEAVGREHSFTLPLVLGYTLECTVGGAGPTGQPGLQHRTHRHVPEQVAQLLVHTPGPASEKAAAVSSRP